MRKSGFTLVELLVLVAIFSILAMLLLPMLQGAVESGRTTVCANNEKQIHAAFMQYCDTNNNALPRLNSQLWTGNPGNKQQWMYILREELSPAVVPNGGSDPVVVMNNYKCVVGQFLTCPSTPMPAASASLNLYQGSYGMNTYGIGTSYTNPQIQPKRYLRLSDVRYPSRQIAFGDALGYSYPGMVMVISGVQPVPYPYYWPSYDSRIGYVHGKNSRTNAVFVDGHVKTAGAEILIPEDTGYMGLFRSAPWGSP